MHRGVKGQEDALEKMNTILTKKFGFKNFIGLQEQVIISILSGESSLLLMPTGGGKSLCYLLPSALFEGLTLVVSPLIALMQDQVQKAQTWNLDACALNSNQSRENREKILRKLADKKIKVLYVTPERFGKTDFLDALKQNKVSLFAIDEAHCISQWGHDFRPDYSRLGDIRKMLGNPTTLALTATATPEVQKDILSQLNIPSEQVFSTGIERQNLALNVHEVYGIEEKVRNIVALQHQAQGSVIVYTALIQTLYKLSQELQRLNIQHLVYHGDLDPAQRRNQQNRFINGEVKIILATPAFGLGIDKPDIRMVIHAEMPGSVEAYFQEVGRAGRDGLSSSCHLFYDSDDVAIQMEFLKWANPDGGFILKVYDLIKNHELQIQQQGVEFLREQMNFYNKRDFRVETSLNLLERVGVLEKSSQRLGFSRVREPLADEFQQSTIDQRVKRQNEKLLGMVNYCNLKVGCRMRYIFSYFGQLEKDCKICDLCVSAGPLRETS